MSATYGHTRPRHNRYERRYFIFIFRVTRLDLVSARAANNSFSPGEFLPAFRFFPAIIIFIVVVSSREIELFLYTHTTCIRVFVFLKKKYFRPIKNYDRSFFIIIYVFIFFFLIPPRINYTFTLCDLYDYGLRARAHDPYKYYILNIILFSPRPKRICESTILAAATSLIRARLYLKKKKKKYASVKSFFFFFSFIYLSLSNDSHSAYIRGNKYNFQ